MASEDEDVAAYLSEVQQIPLLSLLEERDGLKSGREGDELARKRVIEGHLELTALLALRLAPDWLRPLDAVQEANLVLVCLVDDPSVAHPAGSLTEALQARFA